MPSSPGVQEWWLGATLQPQSVTLQPPKSNMNWLSFYQTTIFLCLWISGFAWRVGKETEKNATFSWLVERRGRTKVSELELTLSWAVAKTNDSKHLM